MRGLFKQNPPLGCAFGSDCFHLAGPRAGDSGGGELNLLEGRLAHESGANLLDIEASSAAVKAAFSATGLSRAASFFPGRSQRVFLSVPSHLLHFRTIRLAQMPDAELLSATHWKITEEIGVDPLESTSQVVTAWPVEESGKQKTEVLAVLAKNQDLEPYLNIAENAGLTVAAIDLASRAICRSLWRNTAMSSTASTQPDQLLLVLEEEFATLTIGSGSEIRYMRILQAGLARLGQLQSQLNGESPAASKSAKPIPSDREAAPNDLQKQAESIYSRELSREISLAVRYFEETVGTGSPDHGVIIAAQRFSAGAAASLSNLTSIQFHPADAPPGAPASASPESCMFEFGSKWHEPIGLSLYEQDHLAPQCAGVSAEREARCA
jgi:Tfp pilus assembly PilM family ATPase